MKGMAGDVKLYTVKTLEPSPSSLASSQRVRSFTTNAAKGYFPWLHRAESCQ